MGEPVSIHNLYTQLQARYPTSSLISDLVQVHGDRFVVRTAVQLGSVTLATAMAAAETIEQAEDHARQRVLDVLGITVSTAHRLGELSSNRLPNGNATPLPAIALESATLTPTPPPASVPSIYLDLPSVAKPTLNPSSPPPPSLDQPATPLPMDESAVQANTIVSFPKNFPSLEPLPEHPAAPHARDEDVDLMADLDEFSSNEPVDLSELIALTDVEMERIGWNKKRGQTHLKRTYNKQTRAELNEAQLMEFLHYLRALPSESDE